MTTPVPEGFHTITPQLAVADQFWGDRYGILLDPCRVVLQATPIATRAVD